MENGVLGGWGGRGEARVSAGEGRKRTRPRVRRGTSFFRDPLSREPAYLARTVADGEVDGPPHLRGWQRAQKLAPTPADRGAPRARRGREHGEHPRGEVVRQPPHFVRRRLVEGPAPRRAALAGGADRLAPRRHPARGRASRPASPQPRLPSPSRAHVAEWPRASSAPLHRCFFDRARNPAIFLGPRSSRARGGADVVTRGGHFLETKCTLHVSMTWSGPEYRDFKPTPPGFFSSFFVAGGGW